MEKEIKNARITSTMLGYEDHGIMTTMLHLDYGSSAQGFGGWGLDEYKGERGYGSRQPTALCGFFIKRVLEVVGVDKWEDLKGKYIRAEAGWSKVYAIGNLLEDKWFRPEEEFKTFLAGE